MPTSSRKRNSSWRDRDGGRDLRAGRAGSGGRELPCDTDIDQLVFEITAMRVRANFTWIVTGETRVLEQARIGIRHVLERVVGPTECGSRSSERRATRERSRS